MAKFSGNFFVYAITVILFANLPLFWSKKIVPAMPTQLVPNATAVSMNYLGSHAPQKPSSVILNTYPSRVDPSESSKEVHVRPAGTSHYYISDDATDWHNADLDCRAILGPSGHLVYIETEAELRTITQLLLNSTDSVSHYWVGGKYDPRKETFVWDNGVVFGSWIARDKVMQDSKRPFTRISLHVAPTGLALRTQYHNVSDRYICELNE